MVEHFTISLKSLLDPFCVMYYLCINITNHKDLMTRFSLHRIKLFETFVPMETTLNFFDSYHYCLIFKFNMEINHEK